MNDALLGALLVVAVAIVFWCLSVVCEERFVPALAVICDVLKIPDDVAGATLMAAGACSPEVVSSFIALFVTHSALGVGSVVGSEIFIVLVVTLLAFLVLLACTGFTLRRGHGVVFLALYLAFLVWAVAKEYP